MYGLFKNNIKRTLTMKNLERHLADRGFLLCNSGVFNLMKLLGKRSLKTTLPSNPLYHFLDKLALYSHTHKNSHNAQLA